MAAVSNNNEKIQRLTVYAEGLRTKLTSKVPAKHEGNPAAYKFMLETDLRKTLASIEKLR